MFAEIVLTLFYTALFIWVIFKWKFFRFEGIRKIELSVIFIIKILAGTLLALIYTYYYNERDKADIFKFYDDSKYLFDAIYVNTLHYLQLVFGINPDADYLQKYVHNTKFWALQTNDYYKFTATENSNFFNSHRLITQFNAFVRLFSFGHYTIHTVFMCFISLIGLTALYKTFYPFVKSKKKLLIISIFFMPSVLLWSSGVLKEGFIFLGLGLFVYAFFDFIQRKTLKNTILILLSVLLIAFVKYYLLVALIPAMLAYYIAEKRQIQQKIYVYLGMYGAIFLFLIGISFFGNNLPNPFKILSGKQSELIKEGYGGTYCIRNDGKEKEIVYFKPDTKIVKTVIDSSRNTFTVQSGIIAYKYSDGLITDDTLMITDENNTGTYFYEVYSSPKSGSYIEIRKLNPDILSFIKAVPFGFVNVLFRPHIFELSSLMMFPAAFENLMILFGFFLCIVFFKYKNSDVNLILFLISAVFTMYVVVGITTPVIGSIVRYKSPLLPLLMVLFVLVFDVDKLMQLFSKKRKS